MAKRIGRLALANHKGGPGKTVTTVQMAAALAELGRRTLVVDLDPQANTTRRLGASAPPDQPQLTTSEVIANSAPGIAAQAIRACGWPAPYAGLVDVIPAAFYLENRIDEAHEDGAVRRLAIALDGVDVDYDAVLIDTPPSLGHLTRMALRAADAVLVVIEPDYDSIEGAVRVRSLVRSADMRAELDLGDLAFAGLVVNNYDKRMNSHKFQVEGLAHTFAKADVLTPLLPARAVVKDATDAAVPIRLWGSYEARLIADLYVHLAKRLAKRMSRLEIP